MPYIIKKNRNGKYRVINTDTGQFKARNTTKKRAQTQIKLLHFIEKEKQKGYRVLRTIHKKFKKRTRKTRRQRRERTLNRWRRRTRRR